MIYVQGHIQRTSSVAKIDSGSMHPIQLVFTGTTAVVPLRTPKYQHTHRRERAHTWKENRKYTATTRVKSSTRVPRNSSATDTGPSRRPGGVGGGRVIVCSTCPRETQQSKTTHPLMNKMLKSAKDRRERFAEVLPFASQSVHCCL